MISNPLIDRFLAEIGTFLYRGCRGFVEPSLSTTLNKSSVNFFVFLCQYTLFLVYNSVSYVSRRFSGANCQVILFLNHLNLLLLRHLLDPLFVGLTQVFVDDNSRNFAIAD